ncbi:MAG: adenylate/guanylate cyclase domain-containing protein [Umezawaea sp.]
MSIPGTSAPRSDDDLPRKSAVSRVPLLRDSFAAVESRVHRTALFIDQVGSTAMKAKMPEAQWLTTAGFIYDVINQVIAEIETDKEILVKYQGDGALLVFDSADATKAITAAIKIQHMIKRANDNASGSRTIESYCSIGVASGWMVAFTTPNGTFDHLGTVVDKAARLCDAANANAIFIDHDTAGAANTTLLVSPLGAELNRTPKEYLGEAERVDAKGFEQPVEYFEILWDQQRYSVKNKIETARTSYTERQVTSPSRQAPTRIPVAASSPVHQERRQGEVKTWVEDGKYGFIRDHESGEEFYFKPAMLVDSDDLPAVRKAGTPVAFAAKDASPNHKHRQAGGILLIGEFYEGDLVIPKDKPYGWILVEDPQGTRNRVYARNVAAHKTGDALSFRVAKGSRGVYADNIAPAAEQDDAA